MVYLNVYRTSSEDEQVTAKVSAYQGSDWVMEVDSESDLSDALYEAVEKMEVVLIESENGREFTSCDYDVALLWDEAGGNDEEEDWDDEEDEDEDDDDEDDEDYGVFSKKEYKAFGHLYEQEPPARDLQPMEYDAEAAYARDYELYGWRDLLLVDYTREEVSIVPQGTACQMGQALFDCSSLHMRRTAIDWYCDECGFTFLASSSGTREKWRAAEEEAFESVDCYALHALPKAEHCAAKRLWVDYKNKRFYMQNDTPDFVTGWHDQPRLIGSAKNAAAIYFFYKSKGFSFASAPLEISFTIKP